MHTLRYDLAPRHFDDVLTWMQRMGIGGLMLFTGGIDQFSRPHTLKEAETWVEERVPLAEHLARVGFDLEVNVWCTLGHSSRIPWASLGGYQCQLGHRGEQDRAAVCPYDPSWREMASRLYGTYALLRPKTIWIDDDFRYHHHGPAQWTCFCPLHLNQLQTRVGQPISRRKLLRELTRDPEGTVARAWAETLNTALIDMATVICRSVQEISPNTRLGLMASEPEAHAMEGRDWQSLLRALSGSIPAVVRPTLDNYSGGDPRAIVTGTFSGWRTKRLVHPHQIYSEIESYPYGAWNKSARYLRLQMLSAIAVGMGDMTLDLFAYGERAPTLERGVQAALTDAVTANAMVERKFGGGARQVLGVGLPLAADGLLPPRPHGLDGAGDRIFDEPLALLGVGISYDPGQKINVLTETTIRSLNVAELDGYLRNGVVVDAAGAQAILRREQDQAAAGCVVGHVLEAPQQEVMASSNAPVRDLRNTKSQLKLLIPSRGVSVRTWILGPGGKVLGPGLVCLEHPRGGRMAVVADDGEQGGIRHMTWRTAFNQVLWFETLLWLGRGAVPVLLLGAPDAVPLRIEGSRGTLLAILHLSADPLPRVEWLLADPLPKHPSVWRLAEGSWKELNVDWASGPEKMKRLTIFEPVAPWDVVWYWLPKTT